MSEDVEALQKMADEAWEAFTKKRETCVGCYKLFLEYHMRRRGQGDDLMIILWERYMNQRDGCKECGPLYKIHKKAQEDVTKAYMDKEDEEMDDE